MLAAARPGCLVGRSPRSTERCRAQRGCPARLVGAHRSVGGIAESSRSHRLRSARDVYRWELERARGPRDTRSKRRLAEATVGSRAGAWTWWYPSREARLRPRSWTSRALLAKGCLDDSAIPTTDPACSDKVCGAASSALQRFHRGQRLGIHRGRMSASSSAGGGERSPRPSPARSQLRLSTST